MRVLSLTQPWASLICLGVKKIETRSWRTSYRGPLLIHASKNYPKWAQDCERSEPFYSALRPHGLYAYPQLACGNIIGQCVLKDCISTESVTDLNPDEREFGDYSANRYAWILEDGHFLPRPVPAKGSLGLWEAQI
jgi:activating signal cointegrator 1